MAGQARLSRGEQLGELGGREDSLRSATFTGLGDSLHLVEIDECY